MATTYSYLLVAFLNDKVHVGKLESEIQESDIVTALDHVIADNTSCDVVFKAELSTGDQDILDTTVSGHDGSGVDFAQYVELGDELRDRSGKLRVHQTSRKIGLRITWTGAGDDPTDPHAVGGGEHFSLAVASGTVSKYVDFNCVENETWLHEGYLTWDQCSMDLLTLEMVPRVASYTVSSGTNYNLYGGYMAIPAAGDGIINITSDLTEVNGGLVYMPDDDEGNLPTAFWDADWNTTTKKYENIAPAPYGDGRYNIFTYEVTLAKFVNEIPFLANGFIPLNSSDTDQLGHGMRLKMTLDANGNTTTSYIACIMCLHRKRSV